jgi:dynein regulatory complex subunit 2
MPFYICEFEGSEKHADIERIEGVDKSVYNEFENLEQFYKRSNKVLLDKVAIEKQKGSLGQENSFFKSLLKQYLDGVSVNNDVMNSNNPLLVVNNKVSLNRPPVQKLTNPLQIPLVEGNHIVNNIKMQKI